MRFAYYSKLSPASQRVYRESDEIPSLELPAGAAVTGPVAAIRAGLLREDQTAVQRACQALVDALVAGYGLYAAAFIRSTSFVIPISSARRSAST